MSHCIHAKLYSQSEIKSFLQHDSESNLKISIQDYKNNNNIESFLKAYMTQSSNVLLIESNLYNLLHEIESQPNSEQNKQMVDLLKSYQSQAMKMHEEGGLQIPVFNIQARAQGVQNYWLYLALKDKISGQLNTDFKQALNQIKRLLAGNHEAKTLAVKDSIVGINENVREQVSLYFIQSNDMSGVEKFVVDFAIMYKDLNLLDHLINTLSGTQSDYLIRQIGAHFNQDFIIEKLIQQLQSNHPSRLAMTLLKPYVNTDNRVQSFLMDSLNNAQLASAAAFALSEIKQGSALNLLHNKYLNSESKIEKNSILLALRLNQNESVQSVYNQLIQQSKQLKEEK